MLSPSRGVFVVVSLLSALGVADEARAAPTITSTDQGNFDLTTGSTLSQVFTTNTSADWRIKVRGFLTGLTCNTLTNGSTNVPAGLSVSTATGTSTTLRWEGQFTHTQLGRHCLVVEACTPGSTTDCSVDAFTVSVVKPQGAAATIAIPPQTYTDADTQALRVPFYAFNSRVNHPSSAASLIELVSCPAGQTCAPPALPSWVDLTTTSASNRHGFFVTMQPPSGSLGT